MFESLQTIRGCNGIRILVPGDTIQCQWDTVTPNIRVVVNSLAGSSTCIHAVLNPSVPGHETKWKESFAKELIESIASLIKAGKHIKLTSESIAEEG